MRFRPSGSSRATVSGRSLHIGLPTSRPGGQLLASADRTARLARCRELAAAGGTDASPPMSAPVEPATERALPCPRCQVAWLRLICRHDRPSWREILDRSPYTDRWLSPRRDIATAPARAVQPEDTS